MIIVQETTQWNTPLVNHIYFLNSSRNKMYAYIRGDTGESKIFKNPIGFSVKGRTFEIIRKVNYE